MGMASHLVIALPKRTLAERYQRGPASGSSRLLWARCLLFYPVVSQVMLANKCSSPTARIIRDFCGMSSIEHYLDITTQLLCNSVSSLFLLYCVRPYSVPGYRVTDGHNLMPLGEFAKLSGALLE